MLTTADSPETRPAEGRRRGFPRGSDGRRYREARWVVAALVVVLGGLGLLQLQGHDDHSGSVRVWSTKRKLLPGQQVNRSDLVARELPSGEAAAPYVPADDAIPVAHVVQHLVGSGEFLPRAALDSPENASLRAVNVLLPGAQSSNLKSGAYAQVWLARRKGDPRNGQYEKAGKFVDRALVGRVASTPPGAAGDGPRAVEVFVPQAAVGDLIDAVNTDARITVVPIDFPGAS